jgi:hypothetical protein
MLTIKSLVPVVARLISAHLSLLLLVLVGLPIRFPFLVVIISVVVEIMDTDWMHSEETCKWGGDAMSEVCECEE